MRITSAFTVPADIDRAWGLLTDLHRIAPYLPGTTVESIDGDELTGRVGLRIGPMNMNYSGHARIVVKDSTNKLATIEASGRDARGGGTAQVKVKASLSEIEGGTRVTLASDLDLTGRAAHLGQGPVNEAGLQLLEDFAQRLAVRIDEPAPVSATNGGAAATMDHPMSEGRPAEPAGQLRGAKPTKKLLVVVGVTLLVAGATVGRRLRSRCEHDR